MTTKLDVWMSQVRFEIDDPSCSWAFETGIGHPYPVPSPGSLLIVFEQDLKAVEMWEVADVEHFDETLIEDGWTWFAASEMSALVASTAETGITGMDFHKDALQVLPATSGWEGMPIKLDDNQVDELFHQLGWDAELRHR